MHVFTGGKEEEAFHTLGCAEYVKNADNTYQIVTINMRRTTPGSYQGYLRAEKAASTAPAPAPHHTPHTSDPMQPEATILASLGWNLTVQGVLG